jgi:SAM-dependent methyltransferase
MEACVAREDPFRPFSKYPPPGVDARSPNIARVYNAFLGGKDNFAADRQVVDSVLRVAPEAPVIARGNRAFVRRAVRYLVGEAGITQLLDIGSGLPTAGNVHEIAHELNPSVHTMYVDNDPVVHVHGQALLADAVTTEVVTADLRRPGELIEHPEIQNFVDFRQPVGLLLTAVLHHVGDKEDPAGIMAALRQAMAPGSYLVLSSFAWPGPEYPGEAQLIEEIERILRDQLGSGYWREADVVREWFGDWTLIEPGLVPLAEWRPDETGEPTLVAHGMIGGVARKD